MSILGSSKNVNALLHFLPRIVLPFDYRISHNKYDFTYEWYLDLVLKKLCHLSNPNGKTKSRGVISKKKEGALY